MKKIVGLLILLMICSTFIVSAGNILKLDFSENNQQLVVFEKGDAAEFYLNGERNIIIIRKIKPASVDITAFIAQETNGYPYYTTLSKDKTLKIDVERDDIDDLFIGYYKSNENLKYVYLLMQRPENSGTPTGSIIGKIIRENRKYDLYIIIGFILIICLLVFMIIKNKKKEQNYDQTKQNNS